MAVGPYGRLDKDCLGMKTESVYIPTLLVVDSFHGHLMNSLRAKLKEVRNDSAVIPGGLVSLLWPRYISLNKLFKDSI